jgi:hypothetical protein
MSIPLGAARAYMRRGWMPLLIAHQAKNPNRAGWQRFSTTRGELPRFFNGQPQNIDVLLGKPSGGLTDADLDCPEKHPVSFLHIAAIAEHSECSNGRRATGKRKQAIFLKVRFLKYR